MFRVLKCSRDTQMFELQMWTISPSFTLSLASPIQKTEEGAQNHKHRSRGPTSLLVATDELTVTDGSIFVASLDLLKDGIKSINTKKQETMQEFCYFPVELREKQKITSSFAFLRGPNLLHCRPPRPSRLPGKTSSRTVPRKRERKQ